MNNKIASAVLRNSGFDLNMQVKKIDVERVVSIIKNYSLEVVGSMGYDNSQVTKGGISVEGFDDKTLESKLCKGLYATGEVLDVDGDCGGFNIQWAYSSARVVCDNIK